MKNISLEIPNTPKKAMVNWIKSKFLRCYRLSFTLCKISEYKKLHKLTYFGKWHASFFYMFDEFVKRSKCNINSDDIESSIWLWKVLLDNMEAIMQWRKKQVANGWHQFCCAYHDYNFTISVVKYRKKSILFASWEVNTQYFIVDRRNNFGGVPEFININMQFMISLKKLPFFWRNSFCARTSPMHYHFHGAHFLYSAVEFRLPNQIVCKKYYIFRIFSRVLQQTFFAR